MKQFSFKKPFCNNNDNDDNVFFFVDVSYILNTIYVDEF